MVVAVYESCVVCVFILPQSLMSFIVLSWENGTVMNIYMYRTCPYVCAHTCRNKSDKWRKISYRFLNSIHLHCA